MALTIMTHMAKPGPDLFYDETFRLMVETHINILRRENSATEDIPDNHYYQYEGDFYGYLTERKIVPNLWWIYLRVNGMYNPNEFGKDLRDPLGKRIKPKFIRPNDGVLTNIQQMWMSLKK